MEAGPSSGFSLQPLAVVQRGSFYLPHFPSSCVDQLLLLVSQLAGHWPWQWAVYRHRPPQYNVGPF